eukprot:gene26386-17479_t
MLRLKLGVRGTNQVKMVSVEGSSTFLELKQAAAAKLGFDHPKALEFLWDADCKVDEPDDVQVDKLFRDGDRLIVSDNASDGSGRLSATLADACYQQPMRNSSPAPMPQACSLNVAPMKRKDKVSLKKEANKWRVPVSAIFQRTVVHRPQQPQPQPQQSQSLHMHALAGFSQDSFPHTAGPSPGKPPLLDGVKQCSCRKNRCLKLYCQCFSSGVFCSACACLDCSNTTDNAAQVDLEMRRALVRNPGAFGSKVVPKEDGGSVEHKIGCRCRKSRCIKKYCECFNEGVHCSKDLCRCMDCYNQGGNSGRAPPTAPHHNPVQTNFSTLMDPSANSPPKRPSMCLLSQQTSSPSEERAVVSRETSSTDIWPLPVTTQLATLQRASVSAESNPMVAEHPHGEESNFVGMQMPDMDKSMDMGKGKGRDEDMKKERDRDMDKGMDKGMVMAMDKGTDRDKDMDTKKGRDMDRDTKMGRVKDMDMKKDKDRAMDKGIVKGVVMAMDKGMDRDKDRGRNMDMDKDMDTKKDRGKDVDVKKDKDRDMGRDKDRDTKKDRDMKKEKDRDMDNGMVKGRDKNRGRDMKKDRDKYMVKDRDMAKDKDKDKDKGVDKLCGNCTRQAPKPEMQSSKRTTHMLILEAMQSKCTPHMVA